MTLQAVAKAFALWLVFSSLLYISNRLLARLKWTSFTMLALFQLALACFFSYPGSSVDIKAGLRRTWKLPLFFGIGVALNVLYGAILMKTRFSFLRRTTILIGLLNDIIFRRERHTRETVLAILITTAGALSISLRTELLSTNDLFGYALVLCDNWLSVLQGLAIVDLLNDFSTTELQFFRSLTALPIVAAVMLFSHYETTQKGLVMMLTGVNPFILPLVILSSVFGYLLNYYLLQLFSLTSAMAVGFGVNLKNNLFHFILFGYNLMGDVSWSKIQMLVGISISLVGNFVYIQNNPKLRELD